MDTAVFNRASGQTELKLATIELPQRVDLASFDLVLFTRVQVFGDYSLGDYESEITLPLKCHDILSLAGGTALQVRYELGSYPKFRIDLASS